MVTRIRALCALLLVPLLVPTLPSCRPRSSPTMLPLSAAVAGPSRVTDLAAPVPSSGVAPSSGLEPSPSVARSPGVGSTGQRYRWPVEGQPRPGRRFDPPARPWLAGHRGVDLIAPAGATIRAAGSGTVSYAGMVAGRPVISVTHPDGLRTTYEPVDPVVTVGTVVVAGTVLGVLVPGHLGCPEAACLHWGLRRGSDYLDPLALLGLGRTRLLPLAEEPVSVGRAGRAVARRVGRTRRASCTPGRTVAASPARSRG
ncbi:M23 family metallopeptidase [Micromonospora sp. DT229]|uniref:M23 family metallopeptidase n=1 Tax=Micromonospora sp. DT229 TaxID=3393430 RepID=UPI003CF7F603